MTYYEEIQHSAIEAYRYHMNLYRDFYVALEADTNTDTNEKSDEAKDRESITNVNNQSKFAEKIKNILDELLKWLQRFMDSLQLKIKEAITSHIGFKNTLVKYKQRYKPVDTITVTTYKYNLTKLQNIQSGFNSFIENTMNNVNSADSGAMINLNPQRINEEICKKIGIEEVDSVSKMYTALKDLFRGEKQTLTLKAESDLAKYENVCINYNSIVTNMNASMNKLKNKIVTVKREFNNAMRADKENKNIYQNKLNNLSYIMKVYANMTANFNILFTEYLFTCRAICKQFYKMPTTQL